MRERVKVRELEGESIKDSGAARVEEREMERRRNSRRKRRRITRFPSLLHHPLCSCGCGCCCCRCSALAVEEARQAVTQTQSESQRKGEEDIVHIEAVTAKRKPEKGAHVTLQVSLCSSSRRGERVREEESILRCTNKRGRSSSR